MIALVIQGLPMSWAERKALKQFRIENGYRWRDRIMPDAGVDSLIFAGKPGEGKTLLLVRQLLSYERAGFRIAANLKVRDVVNGQIASPCTDWLDMFRLSVEALETGDPLIFGLCEIHLWANSRESFKTPKWWMALMALRRHYKVAILGDTQNLRRCDVILRELMDGIVEVRRPWMVKQIETLTKRSFGYRVTSRIDATEISGSEVYNVLKEGRPAFIPWDVWHCYSTHEMVRPEKYESDDKRYLEEIELLQTRADLAAKVLHIPSFSDVRGVLESVDGKSVAFQMDAIDEVVGSPEGDTGAEPFQAA